MVDQLYTVQEVMGIFKVGDETIYRWIRQGKIKAIKIGQGWRIKSDSLQELSQGALK
jgi:excisionase family DNA binding protein